jgi:branched-chain amino acid transport system ATP-binding protein
VNDKRILLETKALSKNFGNLAAVRDVSIQVYEGEIHAIIGPNGAGKTTFLNLLSGELPASSGTLYFNGREVTGWRSDRLARAGMGRSFQHSSVFEELSVWENVRLAAQTQFPKSFGLFHPAERYGDVGRRVEEVLGEVAAEWANSSRAGEISHGEQRQLEIAMLLALSPKLMLLDEPTSGMSRNETLELIVLLRRISERHTLVLIEHDMDVVFPPAAVREDVAVRTAYLGTA